MVPHIKKYLNQNHRYCNLNLCLTSKPPSMAATSPLLKQSMSAAHSRSNTPIVITLHSLGIQQPSPNGHSLQPVQFIAPKFPLIGLLVDQRLYTSVYYTRQYYNIPSCCITVRLSCWLTVLQLIAVIINTNASSI